MTNIPVQKGEPLVVGNLKIDVAGDQVTLTDTKTHKVKNGVVGDINTFVFEPHAVTLEQSHTDYRSLKAGDLTPSLAKDEHVAISSMSRSHPKTIASNEPYAVTQEIIAAYNRATHDGSIDEKEQEQFKKLEQKLEKLGDHFTDDNLQPLVKKARAIAPYKGANKS